MPRLRVFAGTSSASLVPISVNTSRSLDISSDLFEGKIVVHIKGLNNDDDATAQDDASTQGNDGGYFARRDRQGVTWSIQVQGRFLQEHSADDVLFGNTFDRPLKLPWGTSAVLKFMNFVDPTLTHDLQSSTKPWALSPLIATMPYFSHCRLSSDDADQSTWPEFPAPESLKDDVSQLRLAVAARGSSTPASSTSVSAFSNAGQGSSPRRSSSPSSIGSRDSEGSIASTASKIERHLDALHSPAQRRAYFASEANRRQITFGPLDLITTDFCYGFLSFAGQRGGPRLDLPGGLHINLGKYWDGQPVRFVCCERSREGDSENPWGRIFWCVSIEMDTVDEEDLDEGGDGKSDDSNELWESELSRAEID